MHKKCTLGLYSKLRGSAISQPIAMKFVTHIDLTYVFNVILFFVDWSQDWGLMQSYVRVLLLLEC